jgi:hypothetical protein
MILIPVSAGELFDKISILRLKLKNISDGSKLKNIQTELNHLLSIVSDNNLTNILEREEYHNLYKINEELWATEDIIRECEESNKFEDSFVKHARLDAYLNDKRFLAKRKINDLCDSAITEEKSYKDEIIGRNFNEN